MGATRHNLRQIDMAEVRRVYALGRSLRRIAQDLDLGYTTLRRRMKTGWQPSSDPPPEIDTARLLQLAAAGLPSRKVASLLGISQTTVLDRLAKRDVARPLALCRRDAGLDPLPVGHWLSWGAISAEPLPRGAGG